MIICAEAPPLQARRPQRPLEDSAGGIPSTRPLRCSAAACPESASLSVSSRQCVISESGRAPLSVMKAQALQTTALCWPRERRIV